jgi:hypothetical protein
MKTTITLLAIAVVAVLVAWIKPTGNASAVCADPSPVERFSCN